MRLTHRRRGKVAWVRGQFVASELFQFVQVPHVSVFASRFRYVEKPAQRAGASLPSLHNRVE